MSPIEARLAGLVHRSARSDSGERRRHGRFILARMTAGALALALLPPFLLWHGAPSPAEHVVLAAMAGPLFAAAILTGTGLLTLAQAVLSAALALPIAAFAVASGGLGSVLTPLLLAVPAEALLSGSRRAAIAACGVAATGLAAIAGLGETGFGAASPPPSPWLLAPVFALAAVGHATAALLARLQREEASTAPPPIAEGSLLQAIDDLVTWHDRKGHVLEASAAAAKLAGLPASALLGRGLLARVHVPDRPAFLRAVGEAAASGAAVAQFRLHAGPAEGTGPGRGREAPSRVVWVEMRAHRIDGCAAIRDAAVIAVTRDVSEHRRQIEALDLARDRAERADLCKARFLGAVSHELRTPLNAIIGFSDILAAEGGGERRREYAGIIRDSGRHLLDVANTLLDLSKIETGGFGFAPEPFDMAAVAHGCCDLMSLKADAAGIALARSIAADLPPFVGDRRACRQILINLIANALQFTPRGGEARVGAVRDRDRIVLTVSDTGVGVREADLPRLGDPFFRAGAAGGRSREGAGLGLSVVRGLVGLHGGTISIESVFGEGTRAAVSLPIDGRAGAVPPAAASVATLSRPRERVLAKVG